MTNHLFDAVFAVSGNADATCLLTPDGDILTRGELDDLISSLAGALKAKGVLKGDRVAVQAAKSLPALALYGAAVKIGAALLPLNTAYTAAELQYFLSDAEPRLVICDPAAEPSLAPVIASAGASHLTLDADGNGSLIDLAKAVSPVATPEPCGPDDLAAILYTSGTTGRSKGAMLSHDNLLSNAQSLVSLWQFNDQDTLIHALPIFHTHGLFVAVNTCLLSGARMIFMPAFDAAKILDHLPNATVLMGVPTFYTRLLDLPGLTRDRVENMRLFVSGSAPLLADTHIEFEKRTGHRILERYGMTETNMNTSNPYSGARKPGTVGQPLPGVEVIVSDASNGSVLPVGETGMVEVRGPNVFQGYWRMPEKTAEELRSNGFFITGDLGQFDEDGYLSIVGRSKDLIISGGYNIYPKEIELALDEQPGVRESAVFGVVHPDMGEAVVGVIVPMDDTQPNLEKISNTMQDTLARFKCPRKLIVIDELPRNTMGKVQKNALRAEYANCLS